MSALKIKAKTARSKGKRMPTTELSSVVMTIGHSTRTIEEFIGLLQAHGAARVVDVRTVPRSRHNPQFNKTSLPRALKKVGLGYVHLPGLGGLRHARPDSINMGWRNTSFRGYADYMQTPEFEQSLEELIQLARQEQIAIMCAEAVPWRCHRSLIADALLVRGIRTEDIMSATRRQVHTLTPFAKILGTAITYPTDGGGSVSGRPAMTFGQTGRFVTKKTTQPTTTMKKESRTQQNKESASNKQPSDPREYPLARDSRGSAGREEIRAKTAMVSAPRQSRRPVERSNQKRAHGR